MGDSRQRRGRSRSDSSSRDCGSSFGRSGARRERWRSRSWSADRERRSRERSRGHHAGGRHRMRDSRRDDSRDRSRDRRRGRHRSRSRDRSPRRDRRDRSRSRDRSRTRDRAGGSAASRVADLPRRSVERAALNGVMPAALAPFSPDAAPLSGDLALASSSFTATDNGEHNRESTTEEKTGAGVGDGGGTADGGMNGGGSASQPIWGGTATAASSAPGGIDAIAPGGIDAIVGVPPGGIGQTRMDLDDEFPPLPKEEWPPVPPSDPHAPQAPRPPPLEGEAAPPSAHSPEIPPTPAAPSAPSAARAIESCLLRRPVSFVPSAPLRRVCRGVFLGGPSACVSWEAAALLLNEGVTHVLLSTEGELPDPPVPAGEPPFVTTRVPWPPRDSAGAGGNGATLGGTNGPASSHLHSSHAHSPHPHSSHPHSSHSSLLHSSQLHRYFEPSASAIRAGVEAGGCTAVLCDSKGGWRAIALCAYYLIRHENKTLRQTLSALTAGGGMPPLIVLQRLIEAEARLHAAANGKPTPNPIAAGEVPISAGGIPISTGGVLVSAGQNPISAGEMTISADEIRWRVLDFAGSESPWATREGAALLLLAGREALGRGLEEARGGGGRGERSARS